MTNSIETFVTDWWNRPLPRLCEQVSMQPRTLVYVSTLTALWWPIRMSVLVQLMTEPMRSR